jgi:hypothetical protein
MSGQPFDGRIEEWEHCSAPVPGFKRGWIEGYLYEDAKRRFPDGTFVHTSVITHINETEGWARTRNSLYKLGQKKCRT